MDNIMDRVSKVIRRLETQNFDLTREKIIMKLINTEWNRQTIEGVPHRNVCDLSVTYHILAGRDGGGIASVMVTDQIAERAGMTEQWLYERAAMDTKELFPPTITDMALEIWDIMVSAGMDKIDAGLLLNEISHKMPMYVISNTARLNGAVSILYREKLNDIAESMGSDLYILPSSVNEVIAIPATERPEALVQMVTEINIKDVPARERLSNQVYRYDRRSGKIGIAD